MRRQTFATLLLAALTCLAAAQPSAARELLQVFVKEPYLELHTGPGRGYPVFHVVPRDASIDVLFRRTEWFKVRTERGVEGWAAQREMQRTLLADGSTFVFPLGDRAGYTEHRGEIGAFAGVWGGATLISAYGAVYLNSQLAIEASAGQFLGKFSNGVAGDLGFTHVVTPEARLVPLLMIGTGVLHIEPKATLVTPDNRTEPTAYVGGGLRYYLTRRFFLRAEYKAHYVFTRRNQNQEIDEWKAGFAFFF